MQCGKLCNFLGQSAMLICFWLGKNFLLTSGDSNPRCSGGKPKHCSLSYRTHADISYIQTATYNNYGIWERKNNLKIADTLSFWTFDYNKYVQR